MKSLRLPLVNELDRLNIEEVSDALVNRGIKDFIDTVNWPDDYPCKPKVSFLIARSDTGIYIRFDVEKEYVRASCAEDLSPVYEDSCVEFFCQVPGEGYYRNFEFNCIGACLASKRKGREEDVELFTQEQLSGIKRFASLGRKPIGDIESNWSLTLMIPFSLMGYEANTFPEKLNANFYKCGDKTKIPHFLSWNPIETINPDFHRPEYFGEIILFT